MDRLTYYQDHNGDSLTVWYGDPAAEVICEETDDEVILMKDVHGTVVGQEILHVSKRPQDVYNFVFGKLAVA